MPELSDPKRERFCREVYLTGNLFKSAQAAGFKGATAYKIVKEQAVIDRIAELRAAERRQFNLTADRIVKRWEALAEADPRDLTQHRVGACRYCWGSGHAFQWKTEREYLAARASWLDSLHKKTRESLEQAHGEITFEVSDALALHDPRIPSRAGGFGYRVTTEPNRDCPECNGLGVPFVQIADTTKLSPSSALLFGGVKQTNHGIEIKVEDRAKPLEFLAKRAGVLVDTVKHDATDGFAAGLASLTSRATTALMVRARREAQARQIPSPDDDDDDGGPA
jgi:hypothetical protein